MSNTLHVIKSALDDIQNALDWYESQSIGLEQRFHKALMVRLKFIQTHPEATSSLDNRFRFVQLKKFPFTIYTTMMKPTLSYVLSQFYTTNATNPFSKSVFSQNL